MYTIPIQLSIRKFNAALNVRVIILGVPQVVYVFKKMFLSFLMVVKFQVSKLLWNFNENRLRNNLDDFCLWQWQNFTALILN